MIFSKPVVFIQTYRSVSPWPFKPCNLTMSGHGDHCRSWCRTVSTLCHGHLRWMQLHLYDTFTCRLPRMHSAALQHLQDVVCRWSPKCHHGVDHVRLVLFIIVPYWIHEVRTIVNNDRGTCLSVRLYKNDKRIDILLAAETPEHCVRW